ncbi:MAG: SagB/ThcOx family dehydrogenase [Gammaproteobacteria bacterium]|nr:SagB/ThcOx family dehydrogenase [Gammaproteobacteria bacterium]
MNETLNHYHELSKHHPQRMAPGPGRLDWVNQPDPFRHYEGAPRVELPLLAGELPVAYDDLFRPQTVAARPFTRDNLAHLLELALGLADWKSFRGNRWALRCNPSSGNLHPTEGYLITSAVAGLDAGVYHYRPHDHGLERRAGAPFSWPDGVLVALTGIHWREAWKYGMRAFRYCQHDCGHALAALGYGAAALGWPTRLLDHWGDEAIAALTGVDRAGDSPPGDHETPEALLWIGAGEPPAMDEVLGALAGVPWQGRANALSREHREWRDIPAVAAATVKPAERAATPAPWPALPPLPPVSSLAVSHLVRRRRSAQAFDGVSGIDARAFFRMVDALMPRPVPPWTLTRDAPAVHPVFFVHRVAGLEPGVYGLVRDAGERDRLAAAMAPDWQWSAVPGCPAHLPLFLLGLGDTRGFAATVSCQQDIAADSAFSLAMLARFDDIQGQPWRYRRRFWEAGLMGQVLYLEAEAAGVQGTGIGCYFDDLVHEALGLDTTRYQDLYHFTVGTAVLDSRLESEPPYGHLADRPRVPAVPEGPRDAAGIEGATARDPDGRR